ncbi:Rid family detoxifying hydrolase [Mesorhizobium sp.]|nr:Rid family detoxifying hydrolase [Mesorhizobium sp.]RUV26224.1 RidA family protein [Mesorhizobium sp. M1A.F.Ca.IN.022.04.1.1]RWG37260.1 MAG: RidA family protein [Mesorhizobium sp.]
MPRKKVNVSTAAVVGPYSQAVQAGDFLMCSGQAPVNPETRKLVEGSIADQTRPCFANLFQILNAAGLASDDVVAVNVYLVDMNDFRAMNEVYAQYFEAPYPARMTIGCASLPLGARVEIGLTAVISR